METVGDHGKVTNHGVGLQAGLVLAWLLCGLGGPVSAQEYRITPIPDWVASVSIPQDHVITTDQITGGTHYLLTDTQHRFDGGVPVRYRRLAMKAVNTSGVETVAQLQVTFDPSYEQVALHRLQVWRDDQVQSRLEEAQIQLLQREPELESLIYDGNKTLNIFIDDVRVGDIVEYAYSVEGANPVFQGRVFGSLSMQWSEPVERAHGRLLFPASRQITIASQNAELAATVRHDGHLQEHVWQREAVPALLGDDGTPGWFDPYPRVRWSEYPDWAAVSHWALPLYQVPAQLPAALQAEVIRIKAGSADPREHLVEALRWVQGEIRYLGIELGAGSHAPRTVAEVLGRRYGDCKDKTLMLLSLLDALGIEARAALVHTSTRRGLAELPPSPGVFNHVLVRARLEGTNWWIDPTRAVQPGALEDLYQPDYDLALVVAQDSRDLVPMDAGRPPQRRTIHATMDSRTGMEESVKFSVATTSEGSYAESSRYQFANTSLEDLQKQYLNYYAGYYAGIRLAEPIKVEELANRNHFKTIESYEIDNFWIHSEEKRRRAASIEAVDIRGYLREPSSTLRQSPYALAHPLEVIQTLEVLLPSAWPDSITEETVEDPHFRFVRSVQSKADRLLITDTYTSLRDHVLPEDMAGFVSKLEQARGELNYELYSYDPEEESHPFEVIEWPMIMLVFVLLVIFVALARRLYRYDPAAPLEPANPALIGIGGWLVLPLLGLLLLPLAILFLIGASADVYFGTRWGELTRVGGEDYHSMWAPALLLELVGLLVQLVFGVLLLILLLKKRSSLPRVYIGYMVVTTTLALSIFVLVGQLPDDQLELRKEATQDLIAGLVELLVWGIYFSVSVRVKSTFRVRLQPSEAEPGAPGRVQAHSLPAPAASG